MIKFTGEKDGRTFVGLGLTAGNVKRMKEGKPVVVSLEEMNLPWHGEILIMYGETEQAIADELKEFIGPQTIVHRNEERKRQ